MLTTEGPAKKKSVIVMMTNGLKALVGPHTEMTYTRECIQKFPDWPHGARTADDTALYH
jgi:hypothetical protein